MIPSNIETTIQKQCLEKIVSDFIASYPVPIETLYECSKLSRFGTAYKKNQIIILPGSKNCSMLFGRIEKLLTCTKNGYLLYQKMSCVYCKDNDIFFVDETNEYDVTPIQWLADPRPLQGYALGEAKRMSISLRNNISENV